MTTPHEQGVGLTDQERKVLEHLSEAWNSFVLLGRKHPDDDAEFRRAIHVAQHIIACRVARRVDPSDWWN